MEKMMSLENISTLKKIITWLKSKGDEKIVERLQIRSLTICMKEQIDFFNLEEAKGLSDEGLAHVKKRAESLVKEKCPL